MESVSFGTLLDEGLEGLAEKDSTVDSAETSMVLRSNLLVSVLKESAVENGVMQTPHAHQRTYDSTFIAATLTRSPQGQSDAYFDEVTRQRIHAELTLSSRAYEEREALRTPRGDELPCCKGVECKVFLIPHYPLPGKPLVAYYSPTERALFENARAKGRGKGRAHSALPSNPRPCLLCLRSDAHKRVLALYNDHVEYTPTFAGTETPIITSKIANLVDVEGEYRMDDCIRPYTSKAATIYTGIAAPLVKLNLLAMTFVLDESGGLRVEQNLPRVGQSVPREPTRF